MEQGAKDEHHSDIISNRSFATRFRSLQDTFQCLNAVDNGETATKDHYDECSGVLVPQFSISYFLFLVMVFNIIVAPLSDISLRQDSLMRLDLGWRLSVVTSLVSVSAVGNIFLFANMNDGRRSNFQMNVALFSSFCAMFAVGIEIVHIVFFFEQPVDGKEEEDDDTFISGDDGLVDGGRATGSGEKQQQRKLNKNLSMRMFEADGRSTLGGGGEYNVKGGLMKNVVNDALM